MAEAVVQRLELVHVQQQQRQRALVAARALHLALEGLLEVAVEVQPRQPVGDRQELRLSQQPRVADGRAEVLADDLGELEAALVERAVAVAVGDVEDADDAAAGAQQEHHARAGPVARLACPAELALHVADEQRLFLGDHAPHEPAGRRRVGVAGRGAAPAPLDRAGRGGHAGRIRAESGRRRGSLEVVSDEVEPRGRGVEQVDGREPRREDGRDPDHRDVEDGLQIERRVQVVREVEQPRDPLALELQLAGACADLVLQAPPRPPEILPVAPQRGDLVAQSGVLLLDERCLALEVVREPLSQSEDQTEHGHRGESEHAERQREQLGVLVEARVGKERDAEHEPRREPQQRLQPQRRALEGGDQHVLVAAAVLRDLDHGRRAVQERGQRREHAAVEGGQLGRDGSLPRGEADLDAVAADEIDLDGGGRVDDLEQVRQLAVGGRDALRAADERREDVALQQDGQGVPDALGRVRLQEDVGRPAQELGERLGRERPFGPVTRARGQGDPLAPGRDGRPPSFARDVLDHAVDEGRAQLG